MRTASRHRAQQLLSDLIAFRDTRVLPNEQRFNDELSAGETRWKPVPILEELRQEAKEAGLWNLSLSEEAGGPGLGHLEYAPLAEAMGWNEWLPEVFNSNPPDSGNIGLLAGYATAAQKTEWLEPLLAGRIRSCFAMTEPDVASSDATNIALSAVSDGEDWILNGTKWWISGPGNPLCRLALVMCRTAPDGARGKQHTMMLVPMDTPGFAVTRQLSVFGMDFAPRGFSQLSFKDVRVPAAHVLGEPGSGFELAQARLGGGRLHHAMRCVGAAERALGLLCKRSLTRTAFGKDLATLGSNADIIAECRIEIEMVRELVLSTAHLLDTAGPAAARTRIAQIKVAAPRMACRVVDQAIQLHGATGFSEDTPLAALYARLRTIRIADGPDAVHLKVISKAELQRYGR
jgi:acyl-CoA dehydrogenase